MEKIADIAGGYLKEAEVDYVGLWQIASRVSFSAWERRPMRV